MTDETYVPVVNKTGAAIVVGFILLFSISIIIWTLLYGKSENALHVTAMSWSFTLIVVVLGAVGLGPLLSQILPLMNKK